MRLLYDAWTQGTFHHKAPTVLEPRTSPVRSLSCVGSPLQHYVGVLEGMTDSAYFGLTFHTEDVGCTFLRNVGNIYHSTRHSTPEDGHRLQDLKYHIQFYLKIVI
jgi:hypothetical protein